MNITGRTTNAIHKVDLCEHIAIVINEIDEESEFTADIEIECTICDIIHEVTILIN